MITKRDINNDALGQQEEVVMMSKIGDGIALPIMALAVVAALGACAETKQVDDGAAAAGLGRAAGAVVAPEGHHRRGRSRST